MRLVASGGSAALAREVIIPLPRLCLTPSQNNSDSDFSLKWPPTTPARSPDGGSTVPQQPVDKFIEGNIHVSIWENDSPTGAYRTASLQLRYKAKNSDEWRTSNNYSLGDLENLERAVQEARRRIEDWRAQHYKPSAQSAA